MMVYESKKKHERNINFHFSPCFKLYELFMALLWIFSLNVCRHTPSSHHVNLKDSARARETLSGACVGTRLKISKGIKASWLKIKNIADVFESHWTKLFDMQIKKVSFMHTLSSRKHSCIWKIYFMKREGGITRFFLGGNFNSTWTAFFGNTLSIHHLNFTCCNVCDIFFVKCYSLDFTLLACRLCHCCKAQDKLKGIPFIHIIVIVASILHTFLVAKTAKEHKVGGEREDEEVNKFFGGTRRLLNNKNVIVK